MNGTHIDLAELKEKAERCEAAWAALGACGAYRATGDCGGSHWQSWRDAGKAFLETAGIPWWPGGTGLAHVILRIDGAEERLRVAELGVRPAVT